MVLFILSLIVHRFLLLSLFQRNKESGESVLTIENLTKPLRRITFHNLSLTKCLIIQWVKSTSHFQMALVGIIRYKYHQKIRTKKNLPILGEPFLIQSCHLDYVMPLLLSREQCWVFSLTLLLILLNSIQMTLQLMDQHLKKHKLTWKRFLRDVKIIISLSIMKSAT